MQSNNIQMNKSKNMTMKHLLLTFVFLLPFIGAKANEQKSYEIPGTQVIPIKDTETGGQYELYIKLPQEYSKAKNKDVKYPVIYFTDAMWHMEMLSGSADYIMEDAILVGISWQQDVKSGEKAHTSRFRDYTITKSKDPQRQAKYQFGQASRHTTFIRNDVFTYIENNYRTAPDNRTYFGYSLGGAFGAYILLAQPDTFKNCILGSPALGGDILYLSELSSNATLKHKALNANVFISYGALEKELGEHVEELIALLKNRNDKGLSLRNVVMEGSHQTAFPMTSVRSVTWLSNLKREEYK